MRRGLLLAFGCFFSLTTALASPLEAVRETIDRMRRAATDVERLDAHEDLKGIWRVFLEEEPLEECLNFNAEGFEKVLAIVDGGEGKDQIRVITWNIELADRTNRYGGFIITPEGWTELTQDDRMDNSDALDVQRRYKPEDWPGAIYYDAVVKSHKNKTVWLLLGWQGASGTTTRKVIETLSVSRGRIRFGTPDLEADGRRVKRHHLVYADGVSATIRYEPENERIVMDHLSPQSPELEGMFAFYGPDFSYDAFTWKKGTWVMERDVEVRDKSLGGPWLDPNPQKRRRRN